MKPYTVENTRPRRTITLFGQVLVPARSPGRSTLDLTYEELLSDAVVRRFQEGRLALVRGEMPTALVKLLTEELPEVPASFEPTPTLVPAKPDSELEKTDEGAPPVLFEEVNQFPPDPDPVVEPEEPVVEDQESDLEPEVTVEEEITPLPDPNVYTYESLEAMTVKELRELCKALSLKSSGAEKDLIERILDDQAAKGSE